MIVLLCIQFQMQYTDPMYKIIQSTLLRQKSVNHFVEISLYIGLVHSVATILCHRLLMVSGGWLWLMWLLVPVFTAVKLRRDPIVNSQVIRYAEEQSGETGLLWFDTENVEVQDWKNQINDKWEMVQPPKLTFPADTKKAVGVFCCCLALSWVPVREFEQSLLPTVVQQELAQVQEDVEAMDALTTQLDPEIEGWKESIEDIENGMSVGNTLRTLDDVSQQIEQRQEEAMKSVSEAMTALEQGDGEQLSNALDALRKQNMLPPSAKEQAVSKQNGTENGNGSDQQGDPSSNSQSSSQGQNDLATQQKLSEQLQELQSKIQDVQQSQQGSQGQQGQQGSNQNSAQSSGPKSLSNEQLQQMSEMTQQTSGAQQNGQSNPQGTEQSGNQSGQQSGQGSKGQPGNEGKQDQGANGQSSGQGGAKGQGESADGQPSPSGDEAAGNSALSYGPESDLIPNSNLRALDGVPQVDWENSVQFGTAPGHADGAQSVPISTGGIVQSMAPMIGQQQIAPQHREAVKEFFATDQTDQ